MESRKYLYINRYFAFAFVMFAVLSGVSDNYGEANATSSTDENLAYFMNINHLFIQNSGTITAQIFAHKYNAFSEYVQDIIAKDAAGSIFASMIFCILFFAAIHLNNKIRQNNIWRKAVF
ncbi:MAG: hypothetical protein K0Q65_1074 [Clostridia bacterium]|jgi:hypothetical protein|nr:hypothetical protein [Clostridia bacterium]